MGYLHWLAYGVYTNLIMKAYTNQVTINYKYICMDNNLKQ